MTFQEILINLKQQMFDAISTKDISYLYNLDKRIEVNKLGKFNYYKLDEINIFNILRFKHQLENDRIYAVIPILSKNNTPDEPFIVLSQTFLVTNKSSSSLILKHIVDNLDKTNDLYDIEIVYTDFKVAFKYKEVKFDYHEYKTFN
jgi:hypothetical protein